MAKKSVPQNQSTADAELIRQCVEKVMGWTVLGELFPGPGFFFYPDAAEGEPYRGHSKYIPDGTYRDPRDTWNPLGSDADAFMLVDAITESRGLWFSLRSPWEPSRPDAVMWRAGFTPHGMTGWNGRPDFVGQGPDRRRAIVLAALATVQQPTGDSDAR